MIECENLQSLKSSSRDIEECSFPSRTTATVGSCNFPFSVSAHITDNFPAQPLSLIIIVNKRPSPQPPRRRHASAAIHDITMNDTTVIIIAGDGGGSSRGSGIASKKIHRRDDERGVSQYLLLRCSPCQWKQHPE
jgi:hypothetical protein